MLAKNIKATQVVALLCEFAFLYSAIQVTQKSTNDINLKVQVPCVIRLNKKKYSIITLTTQGEGVASLVHYNNNVSLIQLYNKHIINKLRVAIVYLIHKHNSKIDTSWNLGWPLAGYLGWHFGSHLQILWNDRILT